MTGVPRKIRDLKKAGFTQVPCGNGSHRKYEHPNVDIPAIIPSKEGDDAKPYLEKQVAQKIKESKQP